MPKLERLDWLQPLAAGRGVTLTDDDAANQYLAEDHNALLIGVLCDSQYATKRAFLIPLRLRERLGGLDMSDIARRQPDEIAAIFSIKPALHRFPRRCGTLTHALAREIADRYAGDGSRIWREAVDIHDLGNRLLALPAFGEEKTNWTVGMLGKLELHAFPDWESYRVSLPRRRRAISESKPD